MGKEWSVGILSEYGQLRVSKFSSFMECLELREIKVQVLAPHCKQNEKFQCVSVERQKR